MSEKFNLLGVKISAVTIALACRDIEAWVKGRKKTYVCVAPAATIVDCQRDSSYRAVINAADMVTPDGMPVVWLAKLKGFAQVERTYGPDLMRTLCKKPGLRHYFLGGTTEVLSRLEENLRKELPSIDIAGAFSPSFNHEAQLEDKAVVEAINRAKPDILWVCLGSPKQDFWMKMHRDVLDVPVMIGVGAAFDFLAGTKPQAPRWMQRSGLEWLFRFICEPRRLWKRYLLGNAMFIYYLITGVVRGRL